jgi:hypothetical protein
MWIGSIGLITIPKKSKMTVAGYYDLCFRPPFTKAGDHIAAQVVTAETEVNIFTFFRKKGKLVRRIFSIIVNHCTKGKYV